MHKMSECEIINLAIINHTYLYIRVCGYLCIYIYIKMNKIKVKCYKTIPR